jgi:hypothetical protein
MGHNPVNHPLRPLYRALGGLTGLYLAIFGIVGLLVTGGDGLFASDTDRVLGQGSNLAWSLVSIVLGAVVLGATVLGRNLDTAVGRYLGWALIAIGTFELAVSRTDVNIFNFTISTVVVTYLLGLVLIMVGYYSKVAPSQDTGTPRQERQRQAA